MCSERVINDVELASVQCSPEDMISLSELMPNKSLGPDQIHPTILKCSQSLAPSLYKLFKLSLSMGIVPMETGQHYTLI